MSLENPPFGITREEVLDLAARKLADAYCGEPDLSETAENIIRQRIKELFESSVNKKLEAFLNSEMEKIVGEEIIPVNIWGEREGKPTTIKAELSRRARDFWSVRVDRDGRESPYGGIERSKLLMENIVKDEFAKAIKENAELIVGEFKSALKADATKLVADHIDKLINVRSR